MDAGYAAIISALGVVLLGILAWGSKLLIAWWKTGQVDEQTKRKWLSKERAQSLGLERDEYDRMHKMMSDFKDELKAEFKERIAALEAQNKEQGKEIKAQATALEAERIARGQLDERFKAIEDMEKQCQQTLADLLDSHERLRDEYKKVDEQYRKTAEDYVAYVKSTSKKKPETGSP